MAKNERRYEVTLVGVTTLLMHPDTVPIRDALDRIRAEAKKAKESRAGDDRFPAHTWKLFLYTDEQRKRIIMPADNPMSAIARVASNFKLHGKATLKQRVGLVNFAEPELEFTYGGGRSLEVAQVDTITGTFEEQAAAAVKLGFFLDARPAVVGQSKHIRVRPCFPGWRVRGTLECYDAAFDKSTVQELLVMAGKTQGLGDWRPGAPKRPGWHGRFDVEVNEIT